MVTPIAQLGDVLGAGAGIVVLVLFALLFLLPIAGRWRAFKKAGYPGWASIIPILSFYYTIKISENPSWYIFLLLIPFLNFVVVLKVRYDFMRVFGHGVGYMIGSVIPPVNIYIWYQLGYKAQHQGKGIF
jgi:hypothetical protein